MSKEDMSGPGMPSRIDPDPRRRVTQRDIAERAGVSTSLVSRVLSNKVQYISVSPEKIRRIKQIASDVGY